MAEETQSRDRAEGAESDREKAQRIEKEYEEGKEKVKELEKDPPKNLEDWPTDRAKYQTFGGGEGDHGYDEGPEEKLGPSEVRHHEDGSVEVSGEMADDPDEYKSDPIPGGPTD